jgi:hypothetical protein
VEPDFTKYNIEELEGCLRAIDRENYPERVIKIQERLKTLKTLEAERINRIPKQEREKIETSSRKGGYLTLFIGAIFCCIFLYIGEFPLRHSENISKEDNPILFYGSLSFFAVMTVFGAARVYEQRFKKERA